LARPDLAETKEFIREYQNHTVTAEVFYKVTAAMIEDSRPEMKQLGVMAAGVTPSVQSFELLTGVEKSNGQGSSTGKLAGQYLARYADSIGDISLLLNILRATDPYSQAFALQLIDQMAHKFLVSGTTPNPSAQGQGSTNSNAFQPLIPVLTQMQTSGNSQVASQAQQTLRDIRSLMGESAVASAQ
jgi:hypothetical protein